MRIVRYVPTRRINTWSSNNQELLSHWTPAIDVIENDEAFVLQASIPGIAPEEVEITLDDDVLTIEGEQKVDESIKANDYRLQERSLGSFSRRLRFSTPVDKENIEATYNHGVLTLNIPKAETAKPRKIAVQVK